MSKNREAVERKFEELVIEVLTQDYDLDVVRHGDGLDRRRRSVAILCFDYHHEARSGVAKVVVTIEGVDSFSTMMRVDLGNRERMRQSAEDCEALALFLTEYLVGMREDLFADLDAGFSGELGRREDDHL